MYAPFSQRVAGFFLVKKSAKCAERATFHHVTVCRDVFLDFYMKSKSCWSKIVAERSVSNDGALSFSLISQPLCLLLTFGQRQSSFLILLL